MRGVVLVAASAAVGTLVTVLTGRDPGFALGLLVVIGTIAACLVHDRAADTSSTQLTVNAARWIASGFLAMAVATALAAGIAAVRWLLSRRR
jgi:hypothetical protein